MSKIIVEHNKNYTTISNHHLRDKSISLKAKGLLTFMLSLPDDWDYSISGLSRVCKEGPDSIRSAINELEEHGYMTRRRSRNVNGTLGGSEYVVREIPLKENSVLDKPTKENPTQVAPLQEETRQINTNIQNNLYTKELNSKDNNNDAHAQDEGTATVFSEYMNRIEPSPSPISMDKLKYYVQALGADVCLRAIYKAIDNGIRKWTYIQKILQNCEKDGIRCIADWEAQEEKREESVRKKDGNNDTRGNPETTGKRWNLQCTEL